MSSISMFFDIVLSTECSNASKGQYNYAGKPTILFCPFLG